MTAAVAYPPATAGLREIALFGTLSLALHVGLFLQVSDGGAEGAGDGGASSLTIEAANGVLAALVEEWDRPPEALARTADPASPSPGETSPALRPFEDATATRPAPVLDPPQTPSAPPTLAARPPESPLPPPMDSVAAAPVLGTEPSPRREVGPLHAVPPPQSPPLASAAPPSPALPETRPAPRPANAVAANAPATPHRASGSGAGATSGQSARGDGTAPSPQRHAALQAEWAASIQSRIARHQRYPAGNHGDGRVKVEMVILRSGQLGKVSLAASSGRAALDAAALSAVRRAAPFPPAPDGLTEDWYRVAQWMSFRR